MIHTNNGQQYWLQEVPMEAEVKLFMTNLIWKTFDTPHDGHNIILPDGTWTIHSDSLTITEEQAGDIVERNVCGFEDYVLSNLSVEMGCISGVSNSISSYHSLLRSKQINSRVINLVRI